MMWTIPGTVLQIKREEADFVPQQLEALFFGGGIALSQVTAITGLEAHTVQNWVKRGFLTSPVGKRYSLRQLCRILNINVLRCTMPIERICHLLSYVNGNLDDESDDMIDDSQLYFMFVKLAARMKELYNPDAVEDLLNTYLADYREPVPGAKERVRQVLRIMLTAYLAARMMQETEKMLQELS
jgi:DNA-binding transcriptional MerR regulator